MCSQMNFRQTVSSALPRRVGEGVSPASLSIRRIVDELDSLDLPLAWPPIP